MSNNVEEIGAGAHVNKVSIEISDRTVAVVAIAAAMAALVSSFWAVHESGIAERESRMLQYYTLEMDAKLIAAGIKKPDESIANKLKGERK